MKHPRRKPKKPIVVVDGVGAVKVSANPKKDANEEEARKRVSNIRKKAKVSKIKVWKKEATEPSEYTKRVIDALKRKEI